MSYAERGGERGRSPQWVAGGRGSDIYITAKLYIVGERGRSPQRMPEGWGSDVSVFLFVMSKKIVFLQPEINRGTVQFRRP